MADKSAVKSAQGAAVFALKPAPSPRLLESARPQRWEDAVGVV